MASVLGESGDIFFPKLDVKKDMIPFDDIVKNLLNYLDLKIDICSSEIEAIQKANILSDDSNTYPVYFFKSNTSGEKTFEEFYTESEDLDLNKFGALGIIKNSVKKDLKEIDVILNDLQNIFLNKEFSKSDIVKILKSYLPNFEHIETGRHLDQKM
jgi:hypothetical protein